MVCGACGPAWNPAEIAQYEALKRKVLADEAERKERERQEKIRNGSITSGTRSLVLPHLASCCGHEWNDANAVVVQNQADGAVLGVV